MNYSIIATLRQSQSSPYRDLVVYRNDDGYYRTCIRCRPPKSFIAESGAYFKPASIEEYLHYTTGEEMIVCMERWRSLIYRCQKKGYAKVCDEWLNYINFAKWYEKEVESIPTHMIKGMDLDKDLFCEKTEKTYSPKDCCFIPEEINNIIRSRGKKTQCTRGVYYIVLLGEKIMAKTKEELLSLLESKWSSKIHTLIDKYQDVLSERVKERLLYLANNSKHDIASMFSERIKHLCKEKGIRQKDLATALGISETSFSTASKEERFNIHALNTIADTLGVEVSELFAPKRNSFTCPNCGAEIEVKLHKKEQ